MVAANSFLLHGLLAGLFGVSSAKPLAEYLSACKAIEKAIGNSNVFYPGSADYNSDMYHNFGSSSQVAACSVDPTTAKDVGKVLVAIKAANVPFGVKSGGHMFAKTFSSTEGVQIDLSNFNSVKVDTEKQTVTVGPGQRWDAVYTVLDKYGLYCIGARQPTVGVGGFLVGGGYGWLSNQHGLGIDNILSYELVKPNGNVVTVTAKSNPDLFFALKGSSNNFGIVTSFTINTFPQGTVWGGTISIASKDVPALTAAIAKFSAEVTDPKASMAAYYLGAVGSTETTMLAFIFYDAPAPPAGLYDDIIAIPTLSSDVAKRSMLDLIKASASAPFPRGLVQQIPVMTFPAPLLEMFESEAVVMAETMKNSEAVWVGYLVEPFAPSLLTHAPPSLGNFPTSAWPPARDFSITTSAVWLGWNKTSEDAIIQKAARESSARIAAKAVSLGQKQAAPTYPDTSIYPNYATTWTTAEQLYGSNLPLLQRLKKKYDPTNVMGLAGGVKIIPA